MTKEETIDNLIKLLDQQLKPILFDEDFSIQVNNTKFYIFRYKQLENKFETAIKLPFNNLSFIKPIYDLDNKKTLYEFKEELYEHRDVLYRLILKKLLTND